MNSGLLLLFPVPIGSVDHSLCLPAANAEWLATCHVFIVEEVRSARRFLRQAAYPFPLDEAESLDDALLGKGTLFHVLNEHTPAAEASGYLAAIGRGANVGLLSEAGLPCVADPGALVVRAAQRQGIRVMPLVGPSSLMLALMASGLNGQRFAFNGYLPVERTQRASALRRLEERALREHQTQIFIEAPYRNNQMLEAMASVLRPQTLVGIACDLSLPSQQTLTYPAARWQRERQHIDLHKRNTVFLIGE